MNDVSITQKAVIRAAKARGLMSASDLAAAYDGCVRLTEAAAAAAKSLSKSPPNPKAALDQIKRITGSLPPAFASAIGLHRDASKIYSAIRGAQTALDAAIDAPNNPRAIANAKSALAKMQDVVRGAQADFRRQMYGR